MADPWSIAAASLAKALGGVAGKALTPAGKVKLGSKAERRRVYSRFLEAVVAQATFAEYCRVAAGIRRPWWADFRAADAFAEKSSVMMTELLQAYMELRLVANPGPMDQGDELLDAIGRLAKVVTEGREEYDPAVTAVGEAQRAFTVACQQDLWYLPRRWQVYRPAYWRIFRKNWRRRGFPGTTA